MRIVFDNVLDIAYIYGLTDKQVIWIEHIEHFRDDGAIVVDFDKLGDVLAVIAYQIEVDIKE